MSGLRRLAGVALAAAIVGQGAPGAQPAPAPPPAIVAAAEIVDKASSYLDAQVRVRGFSGAVMIARDGTPILAKAYGWANVEWKVPNTTDTKFRLGSITKQFTAAAVLRLQEQGKLAVDAPICTYLDPCPDAWTGITVHHLLTHTSGIPSYTGMPDYMKRMMVPTTIDEMIGRVRDLPLEFQPGEKFKYNNSGYFLLGAIIEKASGRKYEKVLRDEFFTPLGMADSGYDWPTPILPRRASGYARVNGELANAQYLDMQQPYSAGSLYSTVGDLLKWDQALYTDQVLPDAAREQMFTPFKDNYAYGWAINPEGKSTSGKRQVGHGGGINGFSTMITRVPDDRLVVIVLGNVEDVNAGAIARDLLAIAYGRPFQEPVERTSITVKPEVLSQYVGRYQVTPQMVMAVTLEGEQLMTQATGQPKLEIYAESESKFFLKIVDAQLTFVKDDTGKVTHAVLHQGGRDMRAPRIE